MIWYHMGLLKKQSREKKINHHPDRKGGNMNQEKQRLMEEVNSTLSRARGLYMQWARTKNVNYHTIFVLYLLSVAEACTQKRICTEFSIPKQTVNNIVRTLTADGYVVMQQDSRDRREKIIRLTESGRAYAENCLGRLFEIEEAVMDRMGRDAIKELIRNTENYASILEEEIAKATNDGRRR